jgi:pimeloyl-ACP methyl ester carboxylesterase
MALPLISSWLHRRFVTAATQLRRSTAYVVILLALALGACAPLAQVRKVDPKFRAAQHATSPRLQEAERAIAAGQQLQRSDPDRAAGFYLAAAEAATREMRVYPRDSSAQGHYNFALSRVFSVIRDADRDPWTQRWHVPGPDEREYSVTRRPAANRLWNPTGFDLIPADELDLRGTLVARRVVRDGVGAPLVAVRKPRAPTIRQPFIPPRLYLAVTAVAHFRERKCEIEFLNPLSLETTKISGRTLPSRADFTAPLALGLARERPEKFGVPAMLNPEKFADKGGLIQVQPYDPNKIPLLLVHGLQSTPVVWTKMVNTLWADPAIRRNYQIWVFGYPTGYPVPYSAMLLRRQLDALRRACPTHHRIVLAGHSMGGILSRLMISDSGGDRLWRYFFGKPPAETNLSPASKALLKEALIFKPRRDVGRAIFIATPHRGSTVAQSPIGRLASSLIRKPLQFVRLSSEVVQALVVQEEDPVVMKLKRMPNSIDTLAPNDAFVKAMNELALAKGIPYHSIIGDRGRGDTPNSSDGVVPYWSSHIEGAASERIVPSNHNAHASSQGIAEVISILKQHNAGKGSATRSDSPQLSSSRSASTLSN